MPPTKTALSVQLGIHGKKTEPLDLKKNVLAYIRSTYSDREADESADDCEMVNALRTEIAGLSTAGNASAREALIKCASRKHACRAAGRGCPGCLLSCTGREEPTDLLPARRLAGPGVLAAVPRSAWVCRKLACMHAPPIFPRAGTSAA
jgi:hypothetical protein